MSLIAAEGLTVRYGAQTVLNDVDLSVEPGEIVTIVGPNGSGKTSLFKAIIGAVPPTSGRIRRKPGLRIGYVPQKLHIDPTLPITVERFMRLTQKVSRKAIKSALETAGVPDLLDRQMSALSGGQFQRVLLARALSTDPEILLLDEATQGLDQPGSASFYRQIEDVRKATGCAVLMISHELHVVMSASDRVICLNGHVCCAGAPAVVASAPEYRALFGTGTGGALALYRHDHDHDHHHHHHHHHDDHPSEHPDRSDDKGHAHGRHHPQEASQPEHAQEEATG
ncbi:metal ABC transporter ATP-binding protein [Cognatishimia sp. F0-27]|uniref:metal ABC transporter ATP-binding protein n=1 Tax=Cognatishimia sp. F0-27 TaxID=2816855 RepID=UPI001D0C1790|nr:metal ABC transporter ATP-binding protein [Cognatishimia sp. F0-27]MCC1493163.1 metal ABC transporter ATP-binding protein [Cognatishimia sp. F0-27]